MKRRVKVLDEFKLYCDERKLKTIDVSKNEEFRVVIKDYLIKLKERSKKKRDGGEVGDKQLSRATLKLHLQSIRMFLNWVCKPKSENGRGLLKQHSITTDYQNFILNDEVGEVKREQRIFEDFSKKIREERFSYNEKLKNGTLSVKKHPNQKKVISSKFEFFFS